MAFRAPSTGQFTRGPRGANFAGEMAGWRPNPALVQELKREPAWQHHLRLKAAEVARLAEDNTKAFTRKGFMPRGQPLFVVEEAADGSVIVLNTDYGGHLYEFGSIKTPVMAPLRRAVRAVGLKFVSEGGDTQRGF